MIVRNTPERLQLITQPDHAQLARRIMEHCALLAREPRRETILHAIAKHDNGWAETDAAPSVDPTTGDVLDFVNAPLAERHAVWPRGVGRLAKDPWAAALVAQHAITVYDRFRSDTNWTSFFANMEATRDRLLREMTRLLEELLADYQFVRLGDLISLTFCTGWTEEHRYREWTVRRSGARVVVTPDPFGGAVIPIEIEAREIRRRRFRSSTELQAALASAAVTMLRGEVAGGGR